MSPLTSVGTPVDDPGLPFAESTDVEERLGRTLTAAEEAQVDGTLAAVAGMIRMEASKAASWMPDPIPAVLSEISIQKAISSVVNPHNVAQQSEGLGQYQYSSTFPRSHDSGVLLTAEEGRRIRFAVHGTNSASVRLDSILDYGS